MRLIGKIMLLASIMVYAGTSQAQEDKNIFNHLGVGIGVGTPGFSIELATPITSYVAARLGVDIMPKFSYDTSLDVNLDELSQSVPEQYRTNLPNKIDVTGKLNNTTGHLLFDLYPSKTSRFHFTVGAYLGPSKLIDVYNTDNSQLKPVSDYNAQAVALGQKEIGLELGDYLVKPDANGHADAQIKVQSFRPYLGIGAGRAYPRTKRIGVQFDAGVQFWGTPKVYTQGHELTDKDVDGDDGGLIKTLSKITIYPVISMRLTGRIL